jgi:hypothetical protein
MRIIASAAIAAAVLCTATGAAQAYDPWTGRTQNEWGGYWGGPPGQPPVAPQYRNQWGHVAPPPAYYGDSYYGRPYYERPSYDRPYYAPQPYAPAWR